jgi:hypothetical protein
MKQKIDRLSARLLSLSGRQERVDLFPHVNVDGDALGSALALLLALEKLSVTVRLPLDESVPPKLDFLPALAKVSPVDTSGTGWMVQPEKTIACSWTVRTRSEPAGAKLAVSGSGTLGSGSPHRRRPLHETDWSIPALAAVRNWSTTFAQP